MAMNLALLGPVSAAPETAPTDPAEAQKRLEDYKALLERLKAKQKGMAKGVAVLEKARIRLNKELIETARRIQESEAELTRLEGRLTELAAQELIVRGSLTQHHHRIAKLLAAMQRMGRQPPPVIVTRRADALTMVRSAMLLASVFPQLKQQADQLSQKLAELNRIARDIRAARYRLQREHARLAKNRVRIQKLLAEKKTILATRKAELDALRRILEHRAADVADLTALIKTLKEKAQKIGPQAEYDLQLAARRKRRTSPSEEAREKELQKVAFLNPGRLKPARPFDDSRHSLPLPVKGRLIRKFGAPDSFGNPSQGLFLETRDNAQIISPADGWVVYSGRFRSYGQLLILNAGGGYHVVLAGMEKIHVSLGQFVLAGEPVGVMGVTTKSGGPANEIVRPVLYVEFRKDGRPINPDPWWAPGAEKVQG